MTTTNKDSHVSKNTSKSKNDKATTKAPAPRYVIVATASRPWSVLAGYVEEERDDHVVLREARMILYWKTDTRGLLGLAATGIHGGRVSRAVSRARVRNVEMVLDATEAARAAIEVEPGT